MQRGELLLQQCCLLERLHLLQLLLLVVGYTQCSKLLLQRCGCHCALDCGSSSSTTTTARRA